MHSNLQIGMGTLILLASCSIIELTSTGKVLGGEQPLFWVSGYGHYENLKELLDARYDLLYQN